MTPSLADLSHALIDAARKAGADSADALAVSGTAVSIEIRKRALETAERSEGVEIGLKRASVTIGALLEKAGLT